MMEKSDDQQGRPAVPPNLEGICTGIKRGQRVLHHECNDKCGILCISDCLQRSKSFTIRPCDSICRQEAGSLNEMHSAAKETSDGSHEMTGSCRISVHISMCAVEAFL